MTEKSSRSRAHDEIETPSEFGQAIHSLKTAIDELPSNVPAFGDRTQLVEVLQQEDEDAVNAWQEVELDLRERFEQCEAIQTAASQPGSEKVIAYSPNTRNPVTSLEVTYHEEGQLTVVSSYYISDEQFPFVLGDTSSIGEIALAAAEITARLTYSAIDRVEQDEAAVSPIPVGNTVPSAHQRQREQLDSITQGMSSLEELTTRLRNRPEWTTEDTPRRTGNTANRGRRACRSDGGDTNHCIICGAVPVQGPTLKYKGWSGNLMFCEPCLRRTKRAVEQDRTVLDVIADDLGE